MNTWMNRRQALLTVTALCSSLAWASPCFADDKDKDSTLSLEAARNALGRMVATPEWDEFKFARKIPRASEFKLDSDGRLVAGPWTINLKAKTFGFAIVNSPTFLYASSGEFVKDQKEGWKAEVLTTTRT